jgi:hypothetical protein
MSIKTLLIILLQVVHIAWSQGNEKITVKSGENIAAVLSSYGMYRLPAFSYGNVTFRDGTKAGGKMNFNIYLGEVQFIDSKGDTLSVAHPETIDSVTIDTLMFYYKNGYLQVVAANGLYKLLRKEKIEFRPIKIGAYGNQSPGNSIESYGRATTSPYVNNNHLTLNEDIVVIKETSYFLYYKKYREEKANRQGFLAAFPGLKKQTDDFISSQNINFRNEEDLKKLLAFCTGQAL